jgi:hypothetical protein
VRAVSGVQLELEVVAGAYAAARLDRAAPVPSWASDADLCSVTRTRDELSIICPAAQVPDDVRRHGPFTAFAVRGPLDFGAVGVLLSLAAPLAEAGISILAVSTFDTDLVLVPQELAADARTALEVAGHRFPPAAAQR